MTKDWAAAPKPAKLVEWRSDTADGTYHVWWEGGLYRVAFKYHDASSGKVLDECAEALADALLIAQEDFEEHQRPVKPSAFWQIWQRFRDLHQRAIQALRPSTKARSALEFQAEVMNDMAITLECANDDLERRDRVNQILCDSLAASTETIKELRLKMKGCEDVGGGYPESLKIGDEMADLITDITRSPLHPRNNSDLRLLVQRWRAAAHTERAKGGGYGK